MATGSGDCHMTYLHHPADVGDVGAGVRHGMVRLCLSCERASKIDGPGVCLDGLQPQHHCRRQLVVGVPTLCLLLQGRKEVLAVL